MLEWFPLLEWRALPAVSGIYVIRHTVSGKEYVGLSSNVRRRAGTHTRATKRNSLIRRATLKYGLGEFEICLLCTAPVDALPRLETEAVSARGTLTPAGYNLTAGGEGTWGRRHSDEAKERMRQAQLGRTASDETRERLSDALRRRWTPELRASAAVKMSSRVVTEETRQRMSEANRQRPAEHWEAVAAKTRSRGVSEDTRAKQSTNAKNRSPEHLARISAANSGKVASASTRAAMRAAHSRAVLAWPRDSFVPLEFVSVGDAAVWAGKTGASISNYCSGKTRSPCGTVYTYLE